MRYYWLVIGTLAVWRISHLLAMEDGPWDGLVHIRKLLGRVVGKLMDCFYCLSAWVAAPVALTVAPRRRDTPLVWLALSGAACLLESALARERLEGPSEAPA